LWIPLWLSLRVNSFTGISIYALTEAIHRRGEGLGLAGELPVSHVEEQGWSHIDLSYIAAPLHELDRDGTTARLWREMCRSWPIVRACYQELCPFEGEATAESDVKLGVNRATERGNGPPMPTAPMAVPTSEDWTPADGPSQWAKTFGFSVSTLKRRFKDGRIRHKKLSPKSYQIAIADLPANHQAKFRNVQNQPGK